MRIFRDRPDITIPYLFYNVPFTRGRSIPTNVYPTWWDNMHGDQYDPAIGVVYETIRPYFGPYPGPNDVPLEGQDAFVNGYLYSDYLAGAIPAGFCYNAFNVQVSRLRQAQDVREAAVSRELLLQAQDIPAPDNITSPTVAPCSLMPEKLYATITGSTSADGVYVMTLGSGPPAGYQYFGPLGACPTGTAKLVWFLLGPLHVEHLNWWTGSGAIYNMCAHHTTTCGPYNSTWTMAAGGCGNVLGNTANIRLSVLP